MNKKDLKMYVAPTMDVVELGMSQILCASNGHEIHEDQPIVDD